MRRIRVVHYINQFFAGQGSEDKANLQVYLQEEAVGPGKLLEQLMAGEGEIVATIVGGDNYMNESWGEAQPIIEHELKTLKPDLVIAGPAFNAGRYGAACINVSKVAWNLGIPTITAMYPENPGVVLDHKIVVVPTGSSPIKMKDDLGKVWAMGRRMALGEDLGPARCEGYLPRGIRKLVTMNKHGYERAIEMLLAKLQGTSFRSEIPIRMPDWVPSAQLKKGLEHAEIALVTTGGLIRKGNPDNQARSGAKFYLKYPLAELQGLEQDKWEVYHAGFLNETANKNLNYILPLDYLSWLQKEGVIKSVHPNIFSLPGVTTTVSNSREMGEDMARELNEAGVDGCLLVST